ncbi:MAG TPA: DUF1285 domain-containing protein [Deltaproteobacteria bacterium]|nr:DUF1285 domain-containing protein [Deltaproteobacteria bacterium]HOM28857.1 DUF1285 domain-containing protein [Deltaproteobacteria bacterium]HPP79527.1 DUF1285 domain-containing protein [Deltaproteobacteria bacterium]
MKDGLRDVTASARIRIDREGRWYYNDAEIVNPMVLRTFFNALTRDDHGRYCLVIEPEICYVEVEDTPLVVSCIRGEPDTGLFLRLNNLETYPLDPSRLSIGDANVLYYTLPDGMKVRFSRQAYYSLALMMEELDGSIVLTIAGKPHPICPAE